MQYTVCATITIIRRVILLKASQSDALIAKISVTLQSYTYSFYLKSSLSLALPLAVPLPSTSCY